MQCLKAIYKWRYTAVMFNEQMTLKEFNMTNKVIQTKVNKNGIKYALSTDGATYGVHKLCENYAAHRKGGMSQTWRYVEKGLTLEAAQALFNRRGA